jgi:hypothetical protein
VLDEEDEENDEEMFCPRKNWWHGESMLTDVNNDVEFLGMTSQGGWMERMRRT